MLAACASRPDRAEIPGLEIALAPADEAGRWRVSYALDAPAESLHLVRVPDDVRTRRWRAVNPVFELIHQDGRDIIRRRDGQAFTEAAFTVEASYVSLLKDYAPFSPFGDGGLLIHSGRFHAWPGGCAEAEDCERWRVRVTPPRGADVLLNGVRRTGRTATEDTGDGTNIYVGKGAILDLPLFLAVIDTTLPAPIREKLDMLFPELMRYYAREMRPLGERPMLFVSRGPGTPEGGHGSQGGTLPGQVFMHFYGETDIAADIDTWVPWFFAHEAGHLFQKVREVEEAESWLHEGGRTPSPCAPRKT